MKFLSSPCIKSVGILTLSFQTLEFWPCLYMYKHWNYDLIIFSFQTLESWSYLFLFTLELLSYPSKHWNPGPIIYLYYTLEFSPHPLKHWNFAPIVFYNHWNSGPILTNMGMFIFSFHWKHWNSGSILQNLGILVLIL